MYLFSFCAQPFPGSQVCLEKVREVPAAGGANCLYRVRLSTIGDFRAHGQLPAALNDRYFRGWPAKIYFKLEKSLTGEIVS